MAGKRRLLVLSHVLPFPRTGGQNQRVFYTLQAAREQFHVTFATAVPQASMAATKEKLLALCDEALVMPSRYMAGSPAARRWHQAMGAAYTARTGLKSSNYAVAELEFPPERVKTLIQGRQFDCALFEYWHAYRTTPVFQAQGTPCVLDMHNILWQVYQRQVSEQAHAPAWWKRRAIHQYRAQEEHSWTVFDGVIAINREEQEYARERIPGSTRMFYAPMGTDLSLWPYSWQPARPVRVAYYGGLGNPRNQEGALTVHQRVMPEVWKRFPDAELWLIGSNPPESLKALAADPRVKVTGFVESVQPILGAVTAVVCPWSGTFGFRSRIVEVMALGVPVVASPDAVAGMELEHGNGILLGQDDSELPGLTLRLLEDPAFAADQSRRARQETERLYSLETTYHRLMRELDGWIAERAARPAAGR
jgi:hypothetical protein